MLKSMKWTVLGTCVMLSLMTLFVSVGYATLTGQLTISGTTEWNETANIYITDIQVTNQSNVSGTVSVTKTGFVVFEHGNYTLNRQRNQSNPGGSVTIRITLKNNSGIDQYFAQLTTDPALPQRCVISYPDAQFGVGSVVPQGESRTLTLTIQNTQTMQTVNMNGRESVLVFSPSFDEDTTQDVTKSLADVFANVLAGNGPAGDGEGITYKGQEIAADRILQVLQQNMESVDTGGYIGNVGNATQDRKDLIEAIFGENMTMQIGNTYYTVSVLIKNQQIDNRGQNDMVMYITADQLTLGGGRWSGGAWRDLNIVPVYGLVFINNGAQGYTYCDHLFAGEAPVCDYGGTFGEGYTGSFNTNLWNSTDYPDLTDTSGGQITQQYSTTNGELDEAYQRYVRENP